MGDRKIVQCFGTKRRPRKAEKICRRKYLWTSRGSTAGHFGSKGSYACPHCGTLPDFQHPINRYLDGGLTQEEAQDILKRDYDENWLKKTEAGT